MIISRNNKKDKEENTAMYKCPRIFEFLPELPKTISGKIRRVEIRERDKGKDTDKIKQA